MADFIKSIDNSIKLDFDITKAHASRVGNDLTLIPDGGEPIHVHDFFVTENGSLPLFVLPDGTIIDAVDALANLDIDLSTAAGEQNPSSGLGEYGSDFGSLIEGIDKLGSLDHLAEDNNIAGNVNLLTDNSSDTLLASGINNGTTPGGGGETTPGDGGGDNTMHVLGSVVTEGIPDVSAEVSGWDPLNTNSLTYNDNTYFQLNNPAIEGDTGTGFPEGSNWSSSAGSDPNIGALYKVVDDVTSTESLESAGVFYKFDLACGIPSIPGATGNYLHMRGLGQAVFDLSTDESRAFTENAFGSPTAEEVSQSGGNTTLAYKELISDVLHNTCGITQDIIHDTTLNPTDESAYQLNIISTTVTATSTGVINFGWAWRAADGYGGSGFWVLKDATTGEIVSGGKIAEYNHYAGDVLTSGITNISVPEGGTYVLSIGTTGSNNMYSSPQLGLTSVVLNDSLYSGDLLSDSQSGSDSIDTFNIAGSDGKEYAYHLNDGGEVEIKGSNGYTYHIDLDNNTYYTLDANGNKNSDLMHITGKGATIPGADGKTHVIAMNGDSTRIEVGDATLVVHKDGHYDLISNTGERTIEDFDLNGYYTTTNGDEHRIEFSNDAITQTDVAASAMGSAFEEDSSQTDDTQVQSDSSTEKEAKESTDSSHTHETSAPNTESSDSTSDNKETTEGSSTSDSSLASSSSESHAEGADHAAIEQNQVTTEASTTHLADESSSSFDQQESVHQENPITEQTSAAQEEVSSQQEQATTENSAESQTTEAAGSHQVEESSQQISTTSEAENSANTVEGSVEQNTQYDILNGEEGEIFYIKAHSGESDVIRISDFTLGDGRLDKLDLSDILDHTTISDATEKDSLFSIERDGQDAHISVTDEQGSETIVLENVYSQDIAQGEDINDLILQNIIITNSAN